MIEYHSSVLSKQTFWLSAALFPVIAAPQRANISHIPQCNMLALALGQREPPARFLRMSARCVSFCGP